MEANQTSQTKPAPARYAGSPGVLPPNVGASTTMPAPRSPRARRNAWLPLLIVLLLLGAGGVYLVQQRDGDDADQAQEAPPATSQYGTLYPSSAPKTGFRWTSPASQLETDEASRLRGTALEVDVLQYRTYGDDDHLFSVVAFPSSAGADDEEEEKTQLFAPGFTFGNPSDIEVAESGGQVYRVQTGESAVANGAVPRTGLVAVASVQGAFVIVYALSTDPEPIDRAEFNRLVASIEYDQDAPRVYDRAVAQGYDPLADGELVDVADPATGLSWRSPQPQTGSEGPVSGAVQALGEHPVYAYEDDGVRYSVRVWPAPTGADPVELADVRRLFLRGEQVDDHRSATIAGAPGRVYHAAPKADDPQQKLFAAAVVDGALITVTGTRDGYEEVNAAEFDRLLASITGA